MNLRVRRTAKNWVYRFSEWYRENRALFHLGLYTFLAPMYLLVGLVMFARNDTIPAAIFITLSCLLFIIQGAAMARYLHGR